MSRCASVNLLFLMPVILLMIGLHYLYAGTVGGEQVTTIDFLLGAHRDLAAAQRFFE